MTLYTRTGDRGETSLVGGVRVSKCDPRVEAYGEVDELNAWLGWVRAVLTPASSVAVSDALAAIQRDLFAIGAHLADPGDKLGGRVAKTAVADADVERLERLIDRLDADVPPLRRFVLPGGTEAGAALHLARTVCRRAERRIVALSPPADGVLLRYVNRLSDLLFAMARAVNHQAGASEIEW